jgi:hypothetical protein
LEKAIDKAKESSNFCAFKVSTTRLLHKHACLAPIYIGPFANHTTQVSFHSHSFRTMASTPMDVDSPRAKSTPSGINGLNGLGRHVNGISTTAKVTEVISTFRPTKVPRQPTSGTLPLILTLLQALSSRGRRQNHFNIVTRLR